MEVLGCVAFPGAITSEATTAEGDGGKKRHTFPSVSAVIPTAESPASVALKCEEERRVLSGKMEKNAYFDPTVNKFR